MFGVLAKDGAEEALEWVGDHAAYLFVILIPIILVAWIVRRKKTPPSQR